MAIALAFAALAAWWDVRERRCPNLLTYGAAALGVVLGGRWSLFAWVACAAALPLLRPSWVVGGGDVKMLGALGALCPALGLFVTALVVCNDAPHLGWRLGPSLLRWSACFSFCLGLG